MQYSIACSAARFRNVNRIPNARALGARKTLLREDSLFYEQDDGPDGHRVRGLDKLTSARLSGTLDGRRLACSVLRGS